MIYLKHKESLVDSDDDDGPQDEDAWLLEDLKVLAHLYSRLKDREQLIELVFEVDYIEFTHFKGFSLVFSSLYQRPGIYL